LWACRSGEEVGMEMESEKEKKRERTGKKRSQE
jgi:hypothetical protein